MRSIAAITMTLALAVAGAAQNCVWVASGCRCLMATRPSCRNSVPLGLLAAGNPNFALSADVFNACVAPGLPLFLIVGFPGPRVAISQAVLDPAFGLPCTAGMPAAIASALAGVSGSLTNPWLPMPVPPGLAGSGHVLTAQIVILGPGGAGLSDSTGIIL